MKKRELFEDLMQKKVQAYSEKPSVSFESILEHRNASKGFAWFVGTYKWHLIAGVVAIFIALVSLDHFSQNDWFASKSEEVKSQQRTAVDNTEGLTPAQEQVNHTQKGVNKNFISKEEIPQDAPVVEKEKLEQRQNLEYNAEKRGPISTDQRFNQEVVVKRLLDRTLEKQEKISKDDENQGQKEVVQRDSRSSENVSPQKKLDNSKDVDQSFKKDNRLAEKDQDVLENKESVAGSNDQKVGEPYDDSQTSADQTGHDLIPNTGKRTRWSLSLLYGPSYAYRHLQNTGMGVFQLRQKAERPLYSQMAGAWVGYQWTNNIGVNFGLTYHQRREENVFDYTQQDFAQRFEDRRVKVIHPVLGEIYVTETDTFTDTITTQHAFSNVNRYHTISIPLGIEYTWYKGRMAYGVGLGTGVNFRRAKGQIMQSNTETVDLTSSDFAQRAMGINMHVQTSISYALSDHLSLMMQPRGSLFISPTNGIGYVLNQYDYNLNLLFGVKYRF
jgi:hypothetical protein